MSPPVENYQYDRPFCGLVHERNVVSFGKIDALRRIRSWRAAKRAEEMYAVTFYPTSAGSEAILLLCCLFGSLEKSFSPVRTVADRGLTDPHIST